MAGDEGAAGVPNVGSIISLISKSQIKYEGTLYTINMQDSTIALGGVRSFGTEDRLVPQYIPPQSEVYEFIKFRGSDIAELKIVQHAPPPQLSAVPAAYAPTPPYQQPLAPVPPVQPAYAVPPPPQGGPPAAYHPPPPYTYALEAPTAQQPPPPQRAPPPPPQSAAVAVQPAAAAVNPPGAGLGPAPVPYAPAPSVTLTPGGGSRGGQSLGHQEGAIPPSRPAPPSSYLQAAGAGPQAGRSGRGGGGRAAGVRGGRDPPQGEARGAGGASAHVNGVARAPPPPRALVSPPVSVPKEDFDFEAALAKFEKANIKDAGVAVVSSDDKKKDDFFDELSRESKDTGPGRNWLSEQRKLDMETFGVVGGVRPQYAGRGGQGRRGAFTGGDGRGGYAQPVGGRYNGSGAGGGGRGGGGGYREGGGRGNHGRGRGEGRGQARGRGGGREAVERGSEAEPAC